MGSLSTRAKLVLGSCGLLLTPSVAFADVAPKCGCTVDGTSAGMGWLLLAGVTALVIRYRRRGRR
jgi:MYXO-CTERM domain-containing protein